MPEPIRIDVARSSDADALVEFLAEQGFAAHRSAVAVEVDYAEPARLSDAVEQAIADWLASCDRDLVPVRVDHRRVALRPPAG